MKSFTSNGEGQIDDISIGLILLALSRQPLIWHMLALSDYVDELYFATICNEHMGFVRYYDFAQMGHERQVDSNRDKEAAMQIIRLQQEGGTECLHFGEFQQNRDIEERVTGNRTKTQNGLIEGENRLIVDLT